MGIAEIAVFTALNQVSQAVGAYLARITPAVTSAEAKAACAVGIQLASAVNKASAWGISAATAEFVTTQASEQTAVSQLKSLPPIT